MAANGRKRSERLCGSDLVLVKEVRLGVQKALVVESDFHLVGPQEGDQRFDQPERFFVEWLGLEIAAQAGLEQVSRCGLTFARSPTSLPLCGSEPSKRRKQPT